MIVYSTPALRVGVYCPPGDALWDETNDNIGERPHGVFPRIAAGLVRHGMRLVVTPNDVVFYRPFETYERSLRDARGDVSLFIAPAAEHLDVPSAPVGRVDSPTFLLARRLASLLRSDPDRLLVEETAAELVRPGDGKADALGTPARHAPRPYHSGATGAKLRTITSTTSGENLGFDTVGVGDVNRDHRPDLLASAAEGDTGYMIPGNGRR